MESERILSAIHGAQLDGDYRLDYRLWFSTSNAVLEELKALYKRHCQRYGEWAVRPMSKRYNRLVRVYWALKDKGM